MGKVHTRKLEACTKLCELIGWEESEIWDVQNMPLNADRLEKIIDRIKLMDNIQGGQIEKG